MTASRHYLRFPTIHEDAIAFVAEDDLWLADAGGGRARRLTSDHAPAAWPRLSPDGTRIAFLTKAWGAPEVALVGVEGGAARRLTWWGDAAAKVIGWTSSGRVLATSTIGAPFRSHTWGYALPVDGGPAERLPWGPITGYAPGPGGALVLGRCQSRRSAAAWKRYRGGTAGALWIDPTGAGSFDRLLPDLGGQLEDPHWIGDRLVFLSDHEGWGNVYSLAPLGAASAETDGASADGASADAPLRHTDHGDG